MSLTIKALFHKTEPAVVSTDVFSDVLIPAKAVEREIEGRRQPPVTPAGRAWKGLFDSGKEREVR